METIEAIKKRASLKLAISEREVEDEKINAMLEAGQVAPSARNKQPWRFIVVKDRATIDAMVQQSFSEVNQVAAKAPAFIIVCGNPEDDIIKPGMEYYLFDTGLAVENMLLAATDMGLATHLIAGMNESALKKVLNIPESVRVIVATPVAYPEGETYDEAAKYKLDERTRLELQDIVYYDSWGNCGK